MASRLLFALLGLVCFSNGTSIPEVEKDAEDVRFAGSVDGKTFFAVSNGNSIDWEQARLACQQMNMQLAELTSRRQVDVVRSFADSGQIADDWYWVAGRDAWAPRQFSWHLSNADVSLAETSVVNTLPGPCTCLSFGVVSSRFAMEYCTNVRMYRLCETFTSKVST